MPKVKVGVVCVFPVLDKLMTALAVRILLGSIFAGAVVLELIGVNAELDGTLSTIRKLVDLDEVGVKVLLLYVPVPKFGKVLFDVAAGTSMVDLPKVKVGVTAMLAVEDTFSKDSALVTADTIDTIFVGSVVLIVLVVKFVSFASRIFVAGTFNCAGDVVFGKTAFDFVSIFVLGLDEK